MRAAWKAAGRAFRRRVVSTLTGNIGRQKTRAVDRCFRWITQHPEVEHGRPDKRATRGCARPRGPEVRFWSMMNRRWRPGIQVSSKAVSGQSPDSRPSTRSLAKSCSHEWRSSTPLRGMISPDGTLETRADGGDPAVGCPKGTPDVAVEANRHGTDRSRGRIVNCCVIKEGVGR